MARLAHFVCLVLCTGHVHSLSVALTQDGVSVDGPAGGPTPISIYTPEEIKSGLQDIGAQSLQIAADAKALTTTRKQQVDVATEEEAKKIAKVQEETRETAAVKKDLDDKIEQVTKEVISHKLEVEKNAAEQVMHQSIQDVKDKTDSVIEANKAQIEAIQQKQITEVKIIEKKQQAKVRAVKVEAEAKAQIEEAKQEAVKIEKEQKESEKEAVEVKKVAEIAKIKAKQEVEEKKIKTVLAAKKEAEEEILKETLEVEKQVEEAKAVTAAKQVKAAEELGAVVGVISQKVLKQEAEQEAEVVAAEREKIQVKAAAKSVLIQKKQAADIVKGEKAAEVQKKNDEAKAEIAQEAVAQA